MVRRQHRQRMGSKITIMDFYQIIDTLRNDGVELPYGLHPGSYPGGVHSEIMDSETTWNAYQWNPPEYLKHLPEYSATDANASSKPTWAQIIYASNNPYPEISIEELRDRRLISLRRSCRGRITRAYGEDNHHDEIELRLGGRHTEAQDTERERLRTRYSIIKAWIESTDRTLTELEGLDLTDDANWTGTEWPPTRAPL